MMPWRHKGSVMDSWRHKGDVVSTQVHNWGYDTSIRPHGFGTLNIHTYTYIHTLATERRLFRGMYLIPPILILSVSKHKITTHDYWFVCQEELLHFFVLFSFFYLLSEISKGISPWCGSRMELWWLRRRSRTIGCRINRILPGCLEEPNGVGRIRIYISLSSW